MRRSPIFLALLLTGPAVAAAATESDSVTLPWPAGGGYFITRADIEASRPAYTTDLLRGIPGVRVVLSPGNAGRTVQMRGGCVPRFYLDGQPLQLVRLSLDDVVAPVQLERIEIYRGPSEMPLRFAQDACGAVVLWTRRGS